MNQIENKRGTRGAGDWWCFSLQVCSQTAGCRAMSLFPTAATSEHSISQPQHSTIWIHSPSEDFIEKDTPSPVWVCCRAARLWPPGSRRPPALWACTWWWDDLSSTFSHNLPLERATKKISEIIYMVENTDVNTGIMSVSIGFFLYTVYVFKKRRHEKDDTLWWCVWKGWQCWWLHDGIGEEWRVVRGFLFTMK